jgi:GPH family glycoside/pentoside/hexuronide:cation symporter
MESTESKARKTSPLRYAVGMFGTSIPINMFKTYAAIYYVDRLGLSMASYSLVLFIYTFIDAIDNPVYGYLSDRTRTRWGRRRPWLVIGSILLGLSFIAFYYPPAGFAGSMLFTYFLILYILTGTLDSLVNANYGALFPDLFSGDVLRAKTNAFRQAFQLIAMVISIALTPMITSRLGYSLTALIYACLGVSVILFSTFGCHENPKYQDSEKPKFWDSIFALFRNKKFWIFGFANAFYSATMSLVMSAIPFYVKYALRLPESQTTFLLATVLLIAIAAVSLWVRLIRRFTLLPVWRAALVTLAIGFIPLYFANSLVTAVLSSTLVGLGFAGAISTFDLIGARIIDEDSAKYGLRREGIFSSAMGFMNRLNGLFTSLAFYCVYAFYKFESGDAPGPNPGGASKFLLVIFPFLLMLFSFVFANIMRFPGEEKEAAPNFQQNV